MSKRNYLGGLLGAQTSRQGSFTDPGDVTRYVPNVGMLSLGEAAVESLTFIEFGDWGSSYTDTPLIGSDTVAGDNFGGGAAISGDGSTVVVGAGQNDTKKAYVFVDGVEVAILTPSTVDPNHGFGQGAAISSDGSTIIIGDLAAEITSGVNNSGAVYVYEKPSGGWVDATEDAILGHTDAENNNDFLGQVLSISDDGSVIAGYVNDKNSAGYQDGAVLVYVRPGAAGTWASTNSYTAKLTASNAGSGDKFGEGLSVSGDGNTIACGAYAEDTGGSNAGTVYIYEKPGGGWATTSTEDHFIQGSNIHGSRFFGRSCSLNTDGTLLAVGASGELFDGGSAEGAVHVFSFNGTSWSEDAVLRGLDANGGDSVAAGMAMTRDGATIVATAFGWDDVANNVGCLYVWERPSSGWVDSSSPDRLTDTNSPAAGDNLGFSSSVIHPIGIANDGRKIIAGAPQKGTAGNAILFDDGTTSASKDLPMLPWGGITGRDVFSLVSADVDGSPTDIADMTTTGILGLSDHYTALNRAETIPPVYTFEMWGSGGGGGGYNTSATTTNENSGSGGGGAYVSGTLTGITSGTTLELMVGHVGTSGIGGGNNVATSGNGGGASAIRIQSGAIVAAAGGGGGGGASGASMSYDSTGGRGGNSVDGSAVTATQAGDFYAGSPGMSGTSTAAGTQATNTNAEPPTKTEDLQDGGDGMSGRNLFTGGGTTNNTNPASWGGSGGTGSVDYQAEASGGAGGGGYFGGSGGTGATAGNDGTSGGGGGGSYVNATYVSSYSSEEGSWEDATAHAAAAPTQAAGSSSSQFAAGVGEGGSGWGATVTSETPEDGNPGAVYILLDGVVVASITAGGTETTYTIP